MRRIRLAAVLMLLTSGVLIAPPAFGQQFAPPADASAEESAAPDDTSLDLPNMTLEELVTEAYKAIEIAEDGGPDSADAFKRATRFIGAIRARDPLNDDAEFLSGRSNLLMGRPREAIGNLKTYSSSHKGSNDWLAFKLLGDLYQQAKYYTLARDKYQAAISLNPRDPEPHAGLARTELSLARPDRAVLAVQEAIELTKPERNPADYALLAQALLQDRKVDEAAEAANTAVELARENARNDLANPKPLAELGQYVRVLGNIIQTSIANFPERTEEYSRLVRVQKEQAGISHLMALHTLLRATEDVTERLAPDVPPSLVLEHAKLLIEVGDVERAAQVLAELLAKDIDNAEAQQLLEHLGAAIPAAPSGP